MKHIKKRFLLEFEKEHLGLDNDKFELIHINSEFDHKVLNNRKKSIAILSTDKKEMFAGFVHKVDGVNYVFPVPDPTLIYFHNAQINVGRIKDLKKKLLSKLDLRQELSEPGINEIYNFYSVTSGFVIYLFTSIESYINQLIPDDFIFKKELPKRTELYDKKQIQESLDFKTKITEVIRDATGKDFFLNQTPTNQLIWNLKQFRDDIIHTKPDDNPLKYDKLIKTSLNFKYSDTLDSVAKFMNYYKSDYIVECDCGQDF